MAIRCRWPPRTPPDSAGGGRVEADLLHGKDHRLFAFGRRQRWLVDAQAFLTICCAVRRGLSDEFGS